MQMTINKLMKYCKQRKTRNQLARHQGDLATKVAKYFSINSKLKATLKFDLQSREHRHKNAKGNTAEAC